MKPTTADLLAAGRRGDRHALEALVRRTAPSLLAIAYRVTGDAHAAEDVFQDALVRVLAAPEPRRPIRDGDAWLARVTARLALNHVRGERARRRRETRYALRRDAERDSASRTRREDPLAGEAEVVARAFAALVPEDRAAIWLHVVEDEGVREVAGALGLSRSTAWRRIRAGLARLRTALEGSGRAGALGVLPALLRELPGPRLDAAAASDVVKTIDRALARVASPSSPPRGVAAGMTPARRAAVASAGAALVAGAAIAVFFALSGGPGEPDGPPPPAVAVAPPPPPAVETADVEPAPSPAADDVEPAPPAVAGTRVAFAGLVVDESGAPVAGAGVTVWLDRELDDVFERGADGVLAPRWDFDRVVVRFDAGEFVDAAFRVPANLATATSDADGWYALDVALPAAADEELLPFRVEAVHTDGGGAHRCGWTWADLEDLAGDPVEDVVVAIAPDADLAGSVVDAAGRGLGGAVVAAAPLASELRAALSGERMRGLERAVYQGLRDAVRGLDVRVTRADGEGRFAFHGTPHEAFLLAARAAGRADGVLVPVVSPSIDVSLALAPRRELAGEAVLVPGEEPAGGARIVGFGLTEGESLEHGFKLASGWFSTSTADASGRFVLAAGDAPPELERGVVAGSFDLEGAGVAVTAETRWRPWRPLEAPLRLEFPLSTWTVAGRVTQGAGGPPAAGALARLFAGGEGVLISLAELCTDAAGRFEFDPAPPGATTLVVTDAGSSPAFAEVGAERPGDNVWCDLVLEPSPTVRGRVVGPDGRGAPGVRVEVGHLLKREADLHAMDAFPRDVFPQGRGVTGADGTFEIAHIYGREDVFIWALDESGVRGEAFAGPLEPSGPPGTDIVIELRLGGPTALDVVLVDAGGAPVAGVPVRAFADAVWRDREHRFYPWRLPEGLDEERAYLLEPHPVPGFAMARSDADGRVHFRALPETPLAIDADASFDGEAWGIVTRLTGGLALGEVRRLELLAARHAPIAGRVTSVDGRPLRAIVTVNSGAVDMDARTGDSGVRAWAQAQADAAGAFAVRPAGGGPFRVAIGAEEHRRVWLEDVQPGSEGLVIVLEPIE